MRRGGTGALCVQPHEGKWGIFRARGGSPAELVEGGFDTQLDADKRRGELQQRPPTRAQAKGRGPLVPRPPRRIP